MRRLINIILTILVLIGLFLLVHMAEAGKERSGNITQALTELRLID